ncbi:uncharacterized protein LOC122322834 [Drosophila grimshawi]|uniref:uncharacterized protein LOC122322834 n=1 Tax=Drosophila grimshawi TaxID=7222 RepID=UPI001C935344|nr:uncharacterized protein LOC122322834 [Drosophila grimshawi]
MVESRMNCKRIFRKSWILICSGDFPDDIYTKYGGYQMGDKDPYSVFHLEYKPTTFLLVFHNREFFKCIALDLINVTTSECLPQSGAPEIISNPNNQITCVNHAFLMADELASACTTRQLPDNDYTAILYANEEKQSFLHINENSRCSYFGLNNWMLLLLLCLLWLFIIFRLR